MNEMDRAGGPGRLPEVAALDADPPLARPWPSPRGLHLSGLGHRYGMVPVLEDITLDLPPGRILALVGPSGCGKTTLLHLAAGLLPLQQGRRELAFQAMAPMFQQPRLLPWLDAGDNIALGLKARGLGGAERRRQATAMAAALGLAPEVMTQYPRELSGGMQSRVAMARALVLRPDLLLLDEPFGALDIGLKLQLYRLLLAQREQLGAAVLMITHDLMEALRLADDVLVMAAGPGRVVHRHHPKGPAALRDDASVHADTAALLQVPVVRAAFGLPELEA